MHPPLCMDALSIAEVDVLKILGSVAERTPFMKAEGVLFYTRYLQ